jgi:hypothetical protein
VSLVGKCSCWVTRQRSRYDHCIGTCECYYLVSSFVFWIVEFLGLAAPEWFFSWLSFHFVNKNLSVIYFLLCLFCWHFVRTHLLIKLEVNSIFQRQMLTLIRIMIRTMIKKKMTMSLKLMIRYLLLYSCFILISLIALRARKLRTVLYEIHIWEVVFVRSTKDNCFIKVLKIFKETNTKIQVLKLRDLIPIRYNLKQHDIKWYETGKPHSYILIILFI